MSKNRAKLPLLIFKNRAKIRVVNRWAPTSYRPEGPVSR
jgi:hypothetical protein